ncbi:MAG: TolB family protein [Chitinophagaceae bacterium]|nr:TolB family protein [Chitinophagaceae bacterium]
MKTKKMSRKMLSTFFSILCLYGAAQEKPGIFDGHCDIGVNVKPGAATYMPETGQYIISGAGYNIWADHDEFHFVYKKMKGDFILNARAEFLGSWVDYHRKVGWMVRKTLDGNSPHINAVEHGDGLTSLQYRKTAGGTTEEIKSTLTKANIIQLERTGSIYTMRMAKYGEPFVTEQVSDVDLGDEVYVGLFVGSHNADVLETGVFQDVRISVPAHEGLVPYKEYLGSNIELLEVASGKRNIIYTSAKSLQAPNWTTDGKSLVYNSEGLMYNFNLATLQPVIIPTGSIKNNNNDHVMSLDGKMLGLSSAVQQLGGSVIYTVSVAGGTPKQITPKGPSYLHGWSPDGKNLVFTGQRNNEFDIYSVPATGGKETKLTTAKGLDDGPEYTPDGKFIYFNSNRTGTMQIWRMKPDGSEQEPITHGDYQDWFPHISPDGKWIVFVSFLKEEARSDDHPFYKHVYLRLLPIEGGVPKVIAYVYGGQGTMNTPSWSPDSKRIAFISNTAIRE